MFWDAFAVAFIFVCLFAAVGVILDRVERQRHKEFMEEYRKEARRNRHA